MLEIFIPMFDRRNSKIVPINKLFPGNIYTHVHGHPTPKKGRPEYFVP
jgi:hypothetical protein